MVSVLVLVVWLASILQPGKAEIEEQIWPKFKVNLSESYLPAVVQVLTHFLEELEDMAVPDPPENMNNSTTIASTASTQPDSVTVPINVTSSSTEAHTTSTPSTNPSESPEASSSTSSSRYIKIFEDYEYEDGLEDLKVVADTDLPTGVFLTVSRLHKVLAKEAKRNGFGKLQEDTWPQIEATPYAILERMRDMLAYEAKRLLGLNKLQGFSDSVVGELVKSARATSAEQLRNLLYLMLDNNDVRRRESLAQARIVLDLLNKPCSALLRALEFVPSLPYSFP